MGHIKKFFKKIVGFSSNQEIIKHNYKQLNLSPGCFGLSSTKHLDQNITISLTTYSKRIFDVYLVIESIFQQTIKPNRVILWLAKEEFKDQKLPIKLTNLCERGLEIKYCKDIKSYKKLIPALQSFPKDVIITIDDDMIYPDDFIENMLNAYKKDPGKIYCYRGRYMGINRFGKFQKYSKWRIINNDESSSFLIIPNGIGGILYPPNCFHPDIFKEDLFLAMAPKGDDIWFKTMSLLNGYKCKVIPVEAPFFEKFVVIESSQDIALYHGNISSHENIKQLKKVFNYYNIDPKKISGDVFSKDGL